MIILFFITNITIFASHITSMWGLVGPTLPRFKTRPSGGYGEPNGSGNGNKTWHRCKPKSVYNSLLVRNRAFDHQRIKVFTGRGVNGTPCFICASPYSSASYQTNCEIYSHHHPSSCPSRTAGYCHHLLRRR